MVEVSGEFTMPRVWAAEPAKSRCSESPSTVTVTATRSGSSVKPLSSTKSSPRYTPSGMAAMAVRASRSE